MQLDRVEEITVEQEVDMAWEGRFQVPVCTDENGRWNEEDDPFMASFARLRVEIKVGGGSFVPLIDGPVVGRDDQMSSEPGQSAVTLLVHDDSVYLNRKDSLEAHENQLDHEIAERLYDGVEQIATQDVETTPAPNGSLPPIEIQRGTQIQLLRKLAERQGMHAYVLPGTSPGESIGLFKKLPTEAGDLPNMILLGSDRNIANFQVTNDAQSPSQVEGHSLSITDKVITSATSSFRDLELLGPEAAFEVEEDTGTRTLPPGNDESVDLQRAVAAEAERLSFSFEASGSVLPDCYTGVLAPYKVVTVRGVNARLSGAYVIKKVTHRLTRSIYTQSFSLLRNARSEGSSGGLEDLAGSIF